MNAVPFALGVAVAAFCIWIAVRALNSRDRWAKRVASTALFLPILYYASCGPLFYLFYRLEGPEWMEPVLASYEPVVWATKTSERLRAWHKAYIGWWGDLAIPIAPDDSAGEE